MKKGFSLVELLVVIGIIAVLSAILMPNFMGAREKAKDSERIQDLNTMKTALRMYYNDNQAYPVGTGVTLGAGFTGYMPSAMNLGFTYSYNQTNGGDGFVLCVGLESRGGDQAITSQQKCNMSILGLCGISVGTTSQTTYALCAN